MIPLLLALALMQSDVQSGVITGVVLKSGTVLEQMLPNARVELGGGGAALVTRTDAAGRFVFTNLRPGPYRLYVTKDGFIRKDLGLFTLKNGQQIRDLAFRLDPATTASGRVLDAFGDPLVGVIIQALRRTYDARGNRTFTVVASALTDDRGDYRILWLDPGDHFFFAGGAAVAPTYYPGVTDPEGAKPLRAPVGRELEGVHFRLGRAALWPVSGYVTSAVTGRPISASISVMPASENPNPLRYSASSNVQGTFSVSNPVPPGSYIAVARTNSGELLRAFAVMSLRTVLSIPKCGCPLGFGYDLRLALGPDLATNGRFFADTGSPVDLRRTKVSLTSVEAEFPSPSPVSPQADGQFNIGGVMPSTYVLNVSDLPDDAYVKTARTGSIDVLEKLVTVTREPNPPPLQILLGSDGGRVTVGVVDRENRPLGDAGVVLVPDAARRHRPDQYRLATTDESGRVTIRGIAPGEYKIFAWETLEPNAYLNADYLRNYEEFGVPVRVTPGENSPRAVRVIPAE